MTRITNLAIATRSIERISARFTRLQQATDDATTGTRLRRPSDDPAAMSRVMTLDAADRGHQRELRAAADATSWLNATDASLQTAMSRLQRVRQLMVSAATTRPDGDRTAISAELDAIAEELVGIANTRHHGRPLFGGDVAGDAVAGSGIAFTYTGDAGQVQRKVGATEVVQVNTSAQDAFWFTPPAGFADNVFALVGQMSAAVANGDTAMVAAGLDAVDAGMDQIGRQLAAVGARTNRVDTATVRTHQLAASLATERSELADVDLAEAIVRLRTEETAYQTALAATARSLPPGLAMFLS